MATVRLTSRERLLRAIRGERVDCVPAAPFMYDVAAQFAGVPLRDYYLDPDALVRAQLALHDAVGHDAISIGADNFYIAEGFGCMTTRSDDELPSLVTPPLESLDDVFDLEVPDPQTDGRMPVMLAAIRATRRAVGDEVAIRSPGTGPFALASYFVGSQQWLLEVGMADAGLRDDGPVHHALDLAAEALIRFGIACADAGADVIQCGDSLASCNVISPATYRRFSWPYQVRVFDAWREHGIGAGLLHICGNSTRVLADYRDTGADVIEIDASVDLAEAHRRLGDTVALMGNVDTVTAFLQGSTETMRAAAESCIAATEGRRLVLGSGCIVPRRTPVENIRELVRTAHAHRLNS